MNNTDLSTRSRAALPGGVSHELRYRTPHPVFIDHAKGAEKWDVEGRRYIDFKMGSASQMLGHCHPAIVEAIQNRLKGRSFPQIVTRPRRRGQNGSITCTPRQSAPALPPREPKPRCWPCGWGGHGRARIMFCALMAIFMAGTTMP